MHSTFLPCTKLQSPGLDWRILLLRNILLANILLRHAHPEVPTWPVKKTKTSPPLLLRSPGDWTCSSSPGMFNPTLQLAAAAAEAVSSRILNTALMTGWERSSESGIGMCLMTTGYIRPGLSKHAACPKKSLKSCVSIVADVTQTFKLGNLGASLLSRPRMTSVLMLRSWASSTTMAAYLQFQGDVARKTCNQNVQQCRTTPNSGALLGMAAAFASDASLSTAQNSQGHVKWCFHMKQSQHMV